MNAWETIDRLGAELGAGEDARRKWRERGSVPHRWRLPIMAAALAAGARIDASDFDAPPTAASGKAAA